MEEIGGRRMGSRTSNALCECAVLSKQALLHSLRAEAGLRQLLQLWQQPLSAHKTCTEPML